MAYNRELSQFASLVEVNNTSKRIGISTDINVSGVVTATRFYGSGRFLTDIVATQSPGGTENQVQYNNGTSTGGAELYYKPSNQSLGIGTTNPQYKLDVNGDINFTGTFRQNGSAFVSSRWSAGSGNDIYRLNGNIGIGTTNPTSKLSVVGDGNFTGVITASNFYKGTEPFITSIGISSNGTRVSTAITDFNFVGAAVTANLGTATITITAISSLTIARRDTDAVTISGVGTGFPLVLRDNSLIILTP